MGLCRQEFWSRLPFPSPGDLSDPGIELASPALADGFFTTEPSWKQIVTITVFNMLKKVETWRILKYLYQTSRDENYND